TTHALGTQTDNSLAERLRIDVDRVFGCNTSCKLADQLDTSLLRAQHAAGIGATFEASRGFSIHPELARSLSDRVGRKVRTLDQHVSGLVGDLRLFPAHDSRERN